MHDKFFKYGSISRPTFQKIICNENKKNKSKKLRYVVVPSITLIEVRSLEEGTHERVEDLVHNSFAQVERTDLIILDISFYTINCKIF